MKPQRSVKPRARAGVYLLSLALAAGLQAVPFLLSASLPDLSDAAFLIHALCLYLVHPACAVFFPFLLTRKYRFPAISCFFHFGVFLLFLPFYPDGRAAGVLCLVLGVFGAAVGETLNQRGRKRRR